MSSFKPCAPGGWVKSASTTQLNKIGPQKTVPLYDTIILKEGHLSVRRYKGKNTGSIQSKRQRYCVLWMNNFSSGLDMYFDDTKKKLKRRLSLDRSIEAIALNVRNYNKSHPKDNSCMQLRIGADMYELNTADGLREKKSWCAKLRQAINRDVNMLSGELVGIGHPDDGPVNIQFSCDCVILTCPFKHTFIKTWKLAFVTSFGQSGNTFTFESCSNCCGESKCVIEADQYTSKCLITSMEAAIMEIPSRSQVVMEKNILGDIYHCSHVCLRRFLESRRASAPPRNRRRHREVTTNTMCTLFSRESTGLSDVQSQSVLDFADAQAKERYLSMLSTQQHTYSSVDFDQPLYSTIEDINNSKFSSPEIDERSSHTSGDDTENTSFSSSTFASSTGDSDLHLYDHPPNVSIYDIPSEKGKMLWKIQNSPNQQLSYKMYIPDSDVAYDIPRFRTRLATNDAHLMYDRPIQSQMKKRWNSVGDSLSPDILSNAYDSNYRHVESPYLQEQVTFLSTQV